MSGEGLESVRLLATPDGYARLRLGMELYPWQAKVMAAMEGRGARVALKTCNEAGKTSTVLTALILWHMETFVGSMTVTTSGAYRQIKDQLYPHLQGWAGRLGEKDWEFGDGWGRNVRTGSRLVSFSTDNPGKAEGWHEPPRAAGSIAAGGNPLGVFGVGAGEWEAMAARAERTSLMLAMDEAKTPPLALHEAFERCHATRWINLSSPGAATGPFYDCFHRDADRWATYSAAARDCPHLWDDPVKRAELEDQRQRLRPELVASMIDAEFMPISDGMVFDLGHVGAACGGGVARWGGGRYRKAALDLSGGGDEQVLAIADGNSGWIEWAGFEKDDHRLVELVIGRLKRWGIPPGDCLADDDGLGSVILNEFERRGWPLRRFHGNGKPRDAKTYRNARAEMYFELANHLRQGHVRLADDQTLREELGMQRYIVGSMPLQLVKKEKLPRSPNRADAMAMAFWELPDPRVLAPDDRGVCLTSPTRFPRDREERALSTWDD